MGFWKKVWSRKPDTAKAPPKKRPPEGGHAEYPTQYDKGAFSCLAEQYLPHLHAIHRHTAGSDIPDHQQKQGYDKTCHCHDKSFHLSFPQFNFFK